MKIKFGPAGLGSVKDAEKTLEYYSQLGLKACEIAFTYGIYIKNKEDAIKIGNIAKKLGISLSIHAPYWINLNSDESEKIKASKKRILNCCKIGNWLKAEKVIFHAGYYGKNKEFTFDNIKLRIKEMLKEIKRNKWNIKICAETMGKVNVFGGIEEISKLAKETKCGFCLDFAHILARHKKIEWNKIKKLFPQEDWHIHFSGIKYGEKGEKHHKQTEIREWKNLLKNIPKNKNITIISESPNPINDAFKALKLWKNN